MVNRKAHDQADELVPTRRLLPERLRNLDDQPSWREFFDTYWKLVYGAAIRAGLSDQEAEDVVQETVIGVARKMPEFHYDPAVCSFKGWLMQVTRCRITDTAGASDTANTTLIIRGTQTITFDPIAEHTHGDEPFAISATASSGSPVTFTSLTPSVVTESGNTVTIVGAGTATIRASQAGDANYQPAADVGPDLRRGQGHAGHYVGPRDLDHFKHAALGGAVECHGQRARHLQLRSSVRHDAAARDPRLVGAFRAERPGELHDRLRDGLARGFEQRAG